MKKVIRILDRLEDIVLVSMFGAMVGIIFIQVIMRYVFNNSLSWSEELGKFLFVWISWLGISIGARRREHIAITLITDRLPPAVRRAAEVVSEIVVIGICVVTAYHGATLVSSQATTRYAGIRISISWGYLSVVVGCCLMTLRGILAILEVLRNGAPANQTPAKKEH